MNPLANCPCPLHTADREWLRPRDLEPAVFELTGASRMESGVAVALAGAAFVISMLALLMVIL